MTANDDTSDELLTVELTARIVSAYVRNHAVIQNQVPAVIEAVHGALADAAANSRLPAKSQLVPAVPIKKSVHQDHIICLEDGKKFKSLTRHLRTAHDTTPDEYRRKWSLPPNYPVVAPTYAAERSAFARKIGLGRKPSSEPRGFIGRMLRSK